MTLTRFFAELSKWAHRRTSSRAPRPPPCSPRAPSSGPLLPTRTDGDAGPSPRRGGPSRGGWPRRSFELLEARARRDAVHEDEAVAGCESDPRARASRVPRRRPPDDGYTHVPPPAPSSSRRTSRSRFFDESWAPGAATLVDPDARRLEVARRYGGLASPTGFAARRSPSPRRGPPRYRRCPGAPETSATGGESPRIGIAINNGTRSIVSVLGARFPPAPWLERRERHCRRRRRRSEVAWSEQRTPSAARMRRRRGPRVQVLRTRAV